MVFHAENKRRAQRFHVHYGPHLRRLTGILLSIEELNEGLTSIRSKVASLFGLGGKRYCVLFLAGPRRDEEKDAVEADYDYFVCTSGTHPLPKNAQKSCTCGSWMGGVESRGCCGFPSCWARL